MWWLMLAIVLTLPIMMFIFGLIFLKKPPKKINMIYGYRTSRSMQNMETWLFANKMLGKIWTFAGLAIFFVSLLAYCLPTYDRMYETDYVCFVSVIIAVLQIIPMVCTVIPVEKALSKNFEKCEDKRENKK